MANAQQSQVYYPQIILAKDGHRWAETRQAWKSSSGLIMSDLVPMLALLSPRTNEKPTLEGIQTSDE